jgi:acyl carrier protein
MRDLDSKLVRCFQAIFPDLSTDNVQQASAETIPAWDSVATINLLNVIAEVFQIEFDWDTLEGMNSFAAVRDSISGKIAPDE